MKIKASLSSRARRNLAAFSLIEVIVGMGIIGTVVGAMLSGIATGTFTMRMARENLRATQIMLEKVETIRLYSWDQVNTPGFVPLTFTAPYDPNATNGAANIIYSGAMTISEAPISTSYSNDMKMVTVSLNWKTGSLNRSRSYTTYIARNGLQNYIYPVTKPTC